MDPVTRRSFLIKGTAGAVGTAGVLAGGWALTRDDDASAEPALRPEELDGVDGPVVVEVTDAAAGEVDVLVGEREVKFTDKALVAKVLRAAR